MSRIRTVLLAAILAAALPAGRATAQETRPQILSKAHQHVSGGVVDGPLEVTGSLSANGPLVVDGELVFGLLNPIFSKADVTSEGNENAELPGMRKVETWQGSWVVQGPLVVHGPLTVDGTLYAPAGLTVGGPIACPRQPDSMVFLAAGLHPIGGPIHWSCH